MPRRTHVVRSARWLALAVLAGVFGWSGLHKVIDPAGFSLSVFRVHLIPYAVVNVVSLWIAWLEFTCAIVLLFIPRFRVAALWLVLCLLIVFSLGLGINLILGSHMACGCFSSSPMAHPISWLELLKNLGLIFVDIYALIAYRYNSALNSLGKPGSRALIPF